MNEYGIKPKSKYSTKAWLTWQSVFIKGYIKAPMHFDFVMGVNGGISGEPRDLLFMANSIPAGSTWTVSGVGRFEYPMVTMGILMGGHVRVGFEDNVYIEKGKLAASNGER
ncbi:MAG: 3-keto-5-aminohexanoate cleavage protein [Eubacterium ramulus]